MNNSVTADDSSDIIQDLIYHIEQCNQDIDQLSLAKQSSENKLKEMLCHTKHGQHTHQFKDYKITITTGSNYSIDKNKYADYLMSSNKIDERFNIVKIITKYDVNEKAIKDIDVYGTEHDRKLKNSFIKETPRKLHVKIIKMEPKPVDPVYDFSIDSVLTDDINQ